MQRVSLLVFLPLLACQVPQEPRSAGVADRPNFILIYADDLGYGDLGCFGSKKNRTPRLDRMADEGVRLTSFYSTSGVCTPSRSSLMTGCYPRRVNMHKDAKNGWVLFPNARKGLHPDEVTVAEILKTRGYQTACIGKWHLGDQREFLPTRQGFDSYFGIPYSNDMNRKNIPLPLMRGEKVIEAPVVQPPLTRRYTEAAVRFITDNKDRPFFLYLPHTMVHLPLNPGVEYKGKSANGRYGDAVEELDWSTGKILDTLEALGIDQRTMVIFTSDNGSNGRNGGSNAPLRGKKGSTNEGGMREPCIMRWPGRIAAGKVCDEITSTMDVLPTFARLAGAELPKGRALDGHDSWALWSGDAAARSSYTAFYYYRIANLQAVRQGPWKLILSHKQRGRRGVAGKQVSTRLIDLSKDIHEDVDLSAKHPDVVKRLMDLAEVARAELGDGNKAGRGQRPAGLVEKAVPLLLDK